MASKPLIFHVGSRKPFAEEAPVMDAVQRAKADIEQTRGRVAGAALFKVVSRAVATATVHSQAVDIVRAGVAKPSGVAATAAVGNAIAAGANVHAQPERPSAIADAQGQVAASLRRLGVLR